jgi:hypothetical protein
MHRNHYPICGPPALPAGPFFFLLIIIASIASAQQGNDPSFKLSAGTSFGDIFRQTSDRSRTTVFTRGSHVLLSGVRGSDSISLQYLSEEYYAAVDQQQTRFTGSLLLGRRTVTAGYAGRYSVLRYALSAGVPVDASPNTVHYILSLSTAPFGPLLSAAVSYGTAPQRYSAGVSFLDFLMPAADGINGGTAAYSISLSPISPFTADVEYEESAGEKREGESGYSSRTRYHSIIKRMSGTYVFSEEMILQAGATTGEYRLDLDLHNGGLSFGGLTNGASRYVRYSAGAILPLLKGSAEYSFEQYDLSGVGGIESWPFTTLAASIIANRLNYAFSGMVKHHALSNSMSAEFSGLSLSGTLSYHRILADAALEHWEPEFLVFGKKNFTSDPFSINDLHLLGFGITVQFPVKAASVTCSAQQYIPVAVSYRSRTAAPAPGPAPAPAAPSSVSTDGGRHAAVSVTIPF